MVIFSLKSTVLKFYLRPKKIILLFPRSLGRGRVLGDFGGNFFCLFTVYPWSLFNKAVFPFGSLVWRSTLVNWILNWIPRSIENTVRHIWLSILWKCGFPPSFIFEKKLHHTCLAGFQIRLWIRYLNFHTSFCNVLKIFDRFFILS